MLAVLEKSFVSDEYKMKYASLMDSRYRQLGLEQKNPKMNLGFSGKLNKIYFELLKAQIANLPIRFSGV